MTVSQWLVISAIAIPIILIMLDKLAADLAGLIIIAALGLAQFAGARRGPMRSGPSPDSASPRL